MADTHQIIYQPFCVFRDSSPTTAQIVAGKDASYDLALNDQKGDHFCFHIRIGGKLDAYDKKRIRSPYNA